MAVILDPPAPDDLSFRIDDFRAVTVDRSGRPRVVLDLNEPGAIYRERGTFRVAPGQRRDRVAVDDTRYGGEVVTDALRGNATASVTVIVKDEDDHTAAARKVEAVLTLADRIAAAGDLYLQFRSGFLDREVLLPVRGPATAQPVYEAHVFTGARLTRVELSWPIAPLAEGLPMDVVDDFQAPDALAEYTTGTEPAAVDSDGLHSIGSAAGAQAFVVHTARGYAPTDLEAFVVGRVEVAGADTDHALTTGLAWQAADGAFFWASLVGGRLNLYYAVPGTNTIIAQSGAATVPNPLVAGRSYAVLVRKLGNLLEAEFWIGYPQLGGLPSASTSITLTEATTPKASEMGEGRRGEAMARAWSPNATATRAVVQEFSVRPYTANRVRCPQPLALPGIPGTAPARVDLEIGALDSSSAIPFGVLGWRRRRAHNMLWNGDEGSNGYGAGGSVDGWATSAATFFASGASIVSQGNPLSLGERRYVKITSGAAASSGARFTIWERIRKGRKYTLEFEAWIETGAWSVQVVGDDTARDLALTGIAAPAGAFTKIQLSFVATADRERFDVGFVHPAAAAGDIIRVAVARVWEGGPEDAPAAVNQRGGSGAHPPFGLIHAEADVPALRSAFAPATSAGSLTGRRMETTAAGAVEYFVDPELLEPVEDGASPEIDVELYACGAIASTLTAPRLTASLVPLDLAASRVYTREDGSAGKALVKPASGTPRRTWRIGTLTFDRRSRGRQRLRIDYAPGGGSGTFALEYLVLVPARARAASPTGLVNDSYFPQLIPAFTSKRIRSDLSGQVITRQDIRGYAARDTGVSGEPVELPPGDVELLAWIQSGAVPDDPAAGAAAASDLTNIGVHAAVTPRYRLFRTD